MRSSSRMISDRIRSNERTAPGAKTGGALSSASGFVYVAPAPVCVCAECLASKQ